MYLGYCSIALGRHKLVVNVQLGCIYLFDRCGTFSGQFVQRNPYFIKTQSICCRLLFGHSRKSFLEPMTKVPPNQRDPETLAVSARLASLGVDILRVHALDLHRRFWRVHQRTG